MQEKKELIKTILGYIGTALFFIVFALFLYYPLGYEIETDGGLINLNKRIEVSPSYDMDGSINLTYVGGRKGTAFMLLIDYFNPNWDSYKTEDVLIDNETYEETLKRAKVSLKESEQNATYVALKNAGVDVSISRYDLTIIHVASDAITDIEVGDILVDVEGKKINNYEDLGKIMSQRKVGDRIEMNVLRNKKSKKVYAEIREEEGKPIIGVYINPIIELEYDKDIKIEFDTVSNAYGSSGGLMNSLLIYEKLTKENITNGKVISGTGTILIDGSVGMIDGVKYKLRGAYKKGADIFLVPSDNYEEAMKVKEKYNMDIEIIEAKTFTQVIEELKTK